jgi:hypothetical protein
MYNFYILIKNEQLQIIILILKQNLKPVSIALLLGIQCIIEDDFHHLHVASADVIDACA